MSQNQSQTPAGQNNANPLIKRRVGKYIIEIVRNKCISVANCVAIAPDVFALDEEQIAILLDADPKSNLYTSDDETILMSARSCPTQAIIVYDAETGQQLFP
ncbi:MAG: ferredoxin [Candidatus Abawacabacteria bacterium]|nr:ferredoxin [Candidatus Abawacabacteria bacterium]